MLECSLVFYSCSFIVQRLKFKSLIHFCIDFCVRETGAKPSQFVDDIIPCMEKPEDPTKGAMGLMHSVKLQDRKPTRKTLAFHTSTDKIPKKEIMKADILKLAKSIKIKCTGNVEQKRPLP